MKILKLHHPTGHAYWQADEYEVEMPDGVFFDLNDIPNYKVPEHGWHVIGRFSQNAHRIIVKPDGIYYQVCGASSGCGKTNYKEPFKFIDKSEYDTIEYVGEPLVMSQNLIDDLNDNGMPV